MRTIGVVTVARSDYGIYLPVLRAMQAAGDLRLHLIVAAAHLAEAHGMTVRQIEADGFEIGDRVDMLMASDTAEGIVKSMGVGLLGFAQSFARHRPDLLLVLGDRTEMHAAALAALPFTLPVAHIHGGELTYGAIDDALRHSLTKLSHLHFVTTEEHATRVRQMGEEPWRVTVSGAPALDRLKGFAPWPVVELERHFGVRLPEAPLLVTYHPVTLEPGTVEAHCDELLAALSTVHRPIIFTGSNADSGGRAVEARFESFVRDRADAWLIRNAGNEGFFSFMSHAAALVGNSSSGLIESPSFKVPAVNIGSRQEGRLRARNVIDVGNDRGAIQEGIRRALDPTFRATLGNLENPYGRGGAAPLIVDVLRTVPLDTKLIRKRFIDAADAGVTQVGRSMQGAGQP
jgi:UDP-hydrolysing UDP-N-acetyl-D-glucosamine 2-epimerase